MCRPQKEAKAFSKPHTCFLTARFNLGDEEINQEKKGYWCHGACRSNDDTSLSGAWLDSLSHWSVEPWTLGELQRCCRCGLRQTCRDTQPAEETHPEQDQATALKVLSQNQHPGASSSGEGPAWPPLGAETVAPLAQKHVSISIPKGHPKLWLSSYFRDHWTSKEPCQLKPDVLKVEPHLPAC